MWSRRAGACVAIDDGGRPQRAERRGRHVKRRPARNRHDGAIARAVTVRAMLARRLERLVVAPERGVDARTLVSQSPCRLTRA
jgi:hypothetical protein